MGYRRWDKPPDHSALRPSIMCFHKALEARLIIKWRFGLFLSKTEYHDRQASSIVEYSSIHVRCEKACSITSICTISQMGSSDEQSSITDQIAYCTIDFSLILRESGDSTSILEIASESKEDHGLDFIFHFRR